MHRSIWLGFALLFLGCGARTPLGGVPDVGASSDVASLPVDVPVGAGFDATPAGVDVAFAFDGRAPAIDVPVTGTDAQISELDGGFPSVLSVTITSPLSGALVVGSLFAVTGVTTGFQEVYPPDPNAPTTSGLINAHFHLTAWKVGDTAVAQDGHHTQCDNTGAMPTPYNAAGNLAAGIGFDSTLCQPPLQQGDMLALEVEARSNGSPDDRDFNGAIIPVHAPFDPPVLARVTVEWLSGF